MKTEKGMWETRVEKWCKDNKNEMDLYEDLMKEKMIEIFKLIDNQSHSGGSMHVLRKNLIIFLLNDKIMFKKIKFNRKIKTW